MRRPTSMLITGGGGSGPEAEVKRVLQELRNMIEDADVTLAELDRRTGRSSGYHSQIFTGHVELRLTQIDAILAALDMDPGEFFRRLFPRVPKPEDLRRQARPELRLNREVLGVYEMGMRETEELRDRLEAVEKALERILASPQVQAKRERKYSKE